MADKTEKGSGRVRRYAIVLGVLYLILQHGFYLAGHHLASLFGFTPFLPKLALDDSFGIVSVFIIPYIWSYAYWAMGPMAVSKCDKAHFADYMAANLVACTAGTLMLAFFPTYMDRIAEGLYAVPEDLVRCAAWLEPFSREGAVCVVAHQDALKECNGLTIRDL